MLELRKYQQRTLDELKSFLNNAATLKGERGIRLAYLDQLGDEAKAYKSISGLEETPFVCIKIPTGGGKTLVGSQSLKVIQDNYLPEKNGTGLVLWLVPSDAIRFQTLTNLRDRNHSYRESLDHDFNSNIKVLTIEEALSIQKADIKDNLCIVVASLATFRRTDKAWLKVFQNNGTLLTHFETLIEATDFLAKDEDGEIINSLGNVIRINSPIVVLDEGHNVQTPLSLDMLRDLNPSFILELTATPRSESNILVQVLASELKTESMVKIPIFLTNVAQWQEVIRDGVIERDKLEKIAEKEKRATKEYIRPIALLQAEQEKESDSKIYVDKVKEFLIYELGISEEEIAIKTATRDQIKDVDLLSPKCSIKYIITVNALKEGWDCPFAYVLVSVANIGSTLAVEQTIGRILRLPHVRIKKEHELNYSYVFTSSKSFNEASSAVIKGLESNGYTRSDLRENTGKVTPEKLEFERFIKDGSIKIPMVGLKSKKDALAFNRDLIGADFKIYEHVPKVQVDFYADQNQKVKIDVDKDNDIVRVIQGKLSLVLHPEDFSKEEVGNWFKRNVRHSAVSAEEMGKYIDIALDQLLEKYGIEELSVNRFRIKEYLQDIALEIIGTYARSQFDQLLKSEDVSTAVATYEPPQAILISRPAHEHFKKHLFEKAGNMNGEELDFAFRLDGLDSILWWFRSREKEDFYLQGWRQGKFYPDFIAKTKSGVYIVAEYKGEDRLSNEDTAYKVELGELWQKLTNNRHKFYLVGRKNADAVIKELSSLA